MAEFNKALVGGFLSQQQINLVNDSFKLLIETGDSTIVRFYDNLFNTAPRLKSLFSDDIERQARKFLQSLRVIVNSLSSMESATMMLSRLGERHRGYGVKPEYYEVVGQVLIQTLDEIILEEAFTDEVREAWTAAFLLISTVMRSSNE